MKTYKIILLLFLVCLSSQAQELVTGKATLSKINNGIYEVKIDSIAKKLDLRPDFKEHPQGTLSVLFKDCEELRQSVFQTKEFTEGKLISLVKEYNECNYSPFHLTEKEAEKAANFQGDELKGFAKLGTSINRIGFFDQEDNESLVQGQLGFGIAATPGFLGSLQGNLYFTLEVEAAFSGKKEFDNSPLQTEFSKNSFQTNFGAEYHFNKNGSFQPLLGLGVGLRKDYYKGNYGDFKIKEHAGSSVLIPKIGVLFSLDDKKSLGLIVSYIPKFTDDFRFLDKDEELVPFTIDTQNINAGIYLYF